MFCLDPPLLSIPKGQWFCHTCLFGTGGDFGFDEGEEHSLSSFQARDLAFRKLWFLGHPPPNSQFGAPLHSAANGGPTSPVSARAGPSSPIGTRGRGATGKEKEKEKEKGARASAEVAWEPTATRYGDVRVTEDDVEREFWRLVKSSNETVEIEYGADVHSTTHGRFVVLHFLNSSRFSVDCMLIVGVVGSKLQRDADSRNAPARSVLEGSLEPEQYADLAGVAA